MLAEQVADQGPALGGLDPQTAKVVNGSGFAQHAGDHFLAVFLDRDEGVAPVALEQDVMPFGPSVT